MGDFASNMAAKMNNGMRNTTSDIVNKGRDAVSRVGSGMDSAGSTISQKLNWLASACRDDDYYCKASKGWAATTFLFAAVFVMMIFILVKCKKQSNSRQMYLDECNKKIEASKALVPVASADTVKLSMPHMKVSNWLTTNTAPSTAGSKPLGIESYTQPRLADEKKGLKARHNVKASSIDFPPTHAAKPHFGSNMPKLSTDMYKSAAVTGKKGSLGSSLKSANMKVKASAPLSTISDMKAQSDKLKPIVESKPVGSLDFFR